MRAEQPASGLTCCLRGHPGHLDPCFRRRRPRLGDAAPEPDPRASSLSTDPITIVRAFYERLREGTMRFELIDPEIRWRAVTEGRGWMFNNGNDDVWAPLTSTG